MADATAIEWTHIPGFKGETWNPVSGCDRVSPGCANCYALTMAARLKAMGQPGYQRDGGPASGPGFGVTLHEEKLDEPLRWRKPRAVFVNSMSDLFHDEVPDEFIERVFVVMARAPQHIFQVLTKRPERALRLLGDSGTRNYIVNRATSENTGAARARGYVGMVEDTQPRWPLPNVWLGVSIENARFTWRADVLREIPAAVRFISAEPLLGSLFAGGRTVTVEDNRELHERYGYEAVIHRLRNEGGRKPLDLTGIDWIIIGGESGPRARPFHLEHARELIAAARYHGDQSGSVPAVFVKQLGADPREILNDELGPTEVGFALRDRKGGDPAEWPADLRVREFPRSAA